MLVASATAIDVSVTLTSMSMPYAMNTLQASFGLAKPGWATCMGRNPQGVWIEFEQHGKSWRVYRPEWGGELNHDKIGLYLDLAIKGVSQRCRWIPPGTFDMGSPATEKQRYHNEAQHQVTLTQGFWLADTACTQAFWRAVMKENPAYFTDNENNPVEQVSWDDVRKFIKQLNQLVPGLAAKLPSEAQWEYACRAGTVTPFCFGKNITPEQVNYDGNFPYAGGVGGLYRRKTVPVKSLPANAWGLYEMHGNVWEWCEDWYDDYPETPVTDPSGSDTGSARVLRGGSWSNHGWRTRSANRGWYTPVNLDNYIGFRLVLDNG